MIIPGIIERKYALIQPYLGIVGSRVRDVVQSYCDRHGYAFVGRVKDTGSLAEKIETGRFGRWRELDDSFACTIIVPTLAEEPRAIEYLESQFLVAELKRRGSTLKDPSVFRFDATRFIGRLRLEMLPDTNAELTLMPFEIQIRTAFEHAWSVTTHALAYKGDQVDWRRIRLAAQLKASVEQIDNLIIGFDQVVSSISEQQWPEISAKKAIEDFFRKQVASGNIPSEAAPKSWGRFCDNFYSVLLATTRERVRDPLKFAQGALQIIQAELSKNGAARFPRSISLIQFSIGTLAQGKFISSSLNRYIPLVTQELRDLYPAVHVLGSGFDCELET